MEKIDSCAVYMQRQDSELLANMSLRYTQTSVKVMNARFTLLTLRLYVVNKPSEQEQTSAKVNCKVHIRLVWEKKILSSLG